MLSPQLIVFEGVDAAGKSAVCAEYLLALSQRGIPATLLSFPGKTPGTLGHLVYELHHTPASVGVDRVTPTSLQALHIAAHLDAIETTILPILEAGETIVLDRYWWSTWVYGIVDAVERGILEALIEAERIAWRQWQPSHLFHVTRSEPLRPEPSEMWARLRREYGKLCERESGKYPIHLLPNDGPIKDTVARALSESNGP